MRRLAIFALLAMTGCAKENFYGGPRPDALTYFEPVPYLQVDTAKDCSKKFAVVSLPGTARSVNVSPGIGASNVAITFDDNGMLKTIGQQVDTKIPDTLSALGSAATNLRQGAMLNETLCSPGTKLYPIVGGKPDMKHALQLD